VLIEVAQPSGQLTVGPSMADVRQFQQATDVFSKVAAFGSDFRGRIVDGPEPERVSVSRLTEDYLAIRGVTPMLGRAFTHEDMEVGAAKVALLGYQYWQTLAPKSIARAITRYGSVAWWDLRGGTQARRALVPARGRLTVRLPLENCDPHREHEHYWVTVQRLGQRFDKPFWKRDVQDHSRLLMAAMPRE
jgi:hypothetical protein